MKDSSTVRQIGHSSTAMTENYPQTGYADFQPIIYTQERLLTNREAGDGVSARMGLGDAECI